VSGRHGFSVFGVLVLLLLLVCFAAMGLGVIALSPAELLQTLAGRGSGQSELVLFEFRLPRLLLGLIVGAGLALSGLVLQGVSRNELAEPGIIGINAGAGLAVIVTLYAASGGSIVGAYAGAPPLLLPLAAFVGAGAASALIFLLALKNGTVAPVRLLLVGIAVNAGIGAITLVLSMRIDPSLYDFAVTWLSGTVAGAGWSEVLAPLPWLAVCTPLILGNARVLDIFALGDPTATGLGIAVNRRRVLLVAAATMTAAACVSVAGGIAFVGLIGPHIARRVLGRAHRVAIPAAMLIGAVLVAAGDLAARTLIAPIEIPVGVVVAIMGAPYFLYLLTRLRGI
jgi:iron complex transport system permease protein